MNQSIDYKKLAYRIGTVLATLLLIVGSIFTIVAIIEMGRVGTNETRYPNSYDYNLLTMQIYGIAMMISGFISNLIYVIMGLKKSSVTP